MGAVYLARQVSLDCLVALKVMDSRKSVHPSFLARFTREAFGSAQLVHHNTVQIYDIHLVRSLHFYSMEYVKGESLFHLVAREGRVDPEVAVGYLLQAARGLEEFQRGRASFSEIQTAAFTRLSVACTRGCWQKNRPGSSGSSRRE